MVQQLDLGADSDLALLAITALQEFGFVDLAAQQKLVRGMAGLAASAQRGKAAHRLEVLQVVWERDMGPFP